MEGQPFVTQDEKKCKRQCAIANWRAMHGMEVKCDMQGSLDTRPTEKPEAAPTRMYPQAQCAVQLPKELEAIRVVNTVAEAIVEEAERINRILK